MERSYHSNTSTILKLSLKRQVASMLTANVYFVKIGLKFEKFESLTRFLAGLNSNYF